MEPMGRTMYFIKLLLGPFVWGRLVRLYQAATYRQDVCTYIYKLRYGKVCLWLSSPLLAGLGGSSLLLLEGSGIKGPSFNKPSPPQTQAGLLVVSAGQPVWCGTFPNRLHFYSSLLVSLFSCHVSLLSSISLHPASLVKKHTWKQWGGDG